VLSQTSPGHWIRAGLDQGLRGLPVYWWHALAPGCPPGRPSRVPSHAVARHRTRAPCGSRRGTGPGSRRL